MGNMVRNFLPTEEEIIALITEGQERAVQELAASEKSVKRWKHTKSTALGFSVARFQMVSFEAA